MYRASFSIPKDRALLAALEVLKGSRRFSLRLCMGKIEVEAKDATALRAATSSILRILQAWEKTEAVL